MQLNKKDALLVKNVLSSFKDDGLLSSEKLDELNRNISVLDFDYKRLCGDDSWQVIAVKAKSIKSESKYSEELDSDCKVCH